MGFACSCRRKLLSVINTKGVFAALVHEEHCQMAVRNNFLTIFYKSWNF
jgi:hypothetical protein